MDDIKIQIQTDTSSICIYDLALLKHRLNDVCDWWTNPEDELLEINNGNVLIIDLGSDGYYEVIIKKDRLKEYSLKSKLKCLTGRVFVGSGESISGENLEPNEKDGTFISLLSGNYEVLVQAAGTSDLEISFRKISEKAVNYFSKTLRLFN